ncbi:hypothetical protein DPMN_176113 [Dreissena polymorpha]|uniref:Uncharacterized protein n=1 Tax=Dreissena polymorpha TaxID=45954 RepID=A0A9D4EAM9_DREPO|nr:hypothetical protein DPMN_176113 [Dreissena polymorpha]
MCYLPKGGDEVRIPPSVPHITNVQDTQRDPHPNTTRYVRPGTHTRSALTPPLITGGAYESATPVCYGFLGGDLCMVVYSVVCDCCAFVWSGRGGVCQLFTVVGQS